MADKKKRGASKCKKMYTDPKKNTIDFNESGLAIGENAARFNSFACLEFKSRIPYYKLVKEIDKKKYDDVWEYIKATWKIDNNDAKDTVIEKGKNAIRNLRHTLVNNYARKDISPFQMYDFLDRNHWKDFVLKAKSKESLETSQKAKMSVENNIDRPRVGRMGFVGLQKYEKDRWKQLVKSYEHLKDEQDELVQRYVVSRAFYNSITGSYELPTHLLSDGDFAETLNDLYCKETEMKKDGTYDEDGKDAVTEVIDKGHQHEGRKRLVSSVCGAIITLQSRKKKKKAKKVQLVREEMNAIQRDKSCVAASAQASSVISLPEIKSISNCELLWPFDDSFPNEVLGHGQVYPTSVRILGKMLIHNDYVKVHVDDVKEKCKGFPIPPPTMIEDEVTNMGSTRKKFIQWPRKAIKLIKNDSPQQSITQHQQPSQHSECYTPAPYDEESIACQKELNSGMKFMELLTNSFPIQPTHSEHVPDPASKASEAFARPTTTKHVTDPDPTSKASEAEPAPKASEPVTDLTATNDVDDPNVFRIAAILKKAKSRPKRIYSFAEQLATYSTHNISIKVTSPSGMFREDLTEDLELAEMMTLCVNGLLELSVLHWYTIYLYTFGGFKGLNDTAYFNPRMIEGGICDEYEQFVIDHIKDVMDLHKDRHYFMAPYLSGGHWSLIVIFHNPKTHKYYGKIIDSRKKGKTHKSYVITKLFEQATGESIIWQMVDCPQQKGFWECGYYVMKAMHDIVISCREKIILHCVNPLTTHQIDQFVEDTLKDFMITL